MSSGFVTEQEINEKKKVRQEEWDRVRKPDDPEIAPEEPYDPRSLFEQLEEHKVKKQEEWDESHKLKNQIRGLGKLLFINNFQWFLSQNTMLHCCEN